MTVCFSVLPLSAGEFIPRLSEASYRDSALQRIEKFWSGDRFPVVYENNEAKAVIVDMATFKKIGMILDNLMNRDTEAEDSLLKLPYLLKKLVDEARKTPPTRDWRTELDEL